VCKHGASCAAVDGDVALVREHEPSNSHGGAHEITRHTTAPTHRSWWHCPYRNWLQHTSRWSHEPLAQWQPQLLQLDEHTPCAPQPHDPHPALQSM
jgi:hypothetical protein